MEKPEGIVGGGGGIRGGFGGVSSCVIGGVCVDSDAIGGFL
jgi:hypothetical protein